MPSHTPLTDCSPGGVFLPNVSSTLSTVTLSTEPSACSGVVVPPTSVPTAGLSVGTKAVGEKCLPEGVWNCIDGTSFQRCASGTWTTVLAMAAGTRCDLGITTYLWEGGAPRSKRAAARMAAAAVAGRV
jgi:hypothetical protein